MSQMAGWQGNLELLSQKGKELVLQLVGLDQEHLFERWPAPGVDDNKKRSFVESLQQLDAEYPGGLKTFLATAKDLLEASSSRRNTLEGHVPSVPKGERLNFGSEEYEKFEEAGVEASRDAAFVLVAGGLGERLGYSGIKLALPTDLARGACFLKVYVESILALQAKAGNNVQLPLAIMTSEHTHERTQKLLEDNAYFGMHPGQITLLKQQEVACLSNGRAHLALAKDDPYCLETKPHGHGDVHALLHSSGLLRRWVDAGVKWVAFFQDTNALVFRGLLPALGVSVRRGYDMNSLAVPRKAKEAIGAIATLTQPDGTTITTNVEYNLLDALLRDNGWVEGDVIDGESGYSPFPGNTDQLILKADSYLCALDATEGVVAESVSPKYVDNTFKAFKSSARLECSMQDVAHALPPEASFGYTLINQGWAVYSPVTNSPAEARARVAAGYPAYSATTGEADVYHSNWRCVEILGAKIMHPKNFGSYSGADDDSMSDSDGDVEEPFGMATLKTPQQREFNGLRVDLWPRVAWSPFFAICFADLRRKLWPRGGGLIVGADTTLVIETANLEIEVQVLRGAYVYGKNVNRVGDASQPFGAVGGGGINEGWEWRALAPDEAATEEEHLRGFLVHKPPEPDEYYTGGFHCPVYMWE